MKFRRIETIQSASITTNRSGNERAVNVCKRSDEAEQCALSFEFLSRHFVHISSINIVRFQFFNRKGWMLIPT